MNDTLKDIEPVPARLGQLTAAQFNERFPVGTPVRFHFIIDEPEFIESRTRSKAWTLGHGAVVVAIDGYAGGMCLEAIAALTPPTEQAEPQKPEA